jgi:hypothetical protein
LVNMEDVAAELRNLRRRIEGQHANAHALVRRG